MIGKAVCGVLAAAALAACSSGDAKLLNLTSTTEGPDEFAIVPNKPLQAPDTYASLPTPTPGGFNRSDANPEAEAIIALGGRPEALNDIPGADAAIVNTVTRYGVTPNIRATLAAEDLEFRRKNDGRLLERLFNVSVYFKAYRRMSLDQYAELERFRRLGVRTPAAPPQPQ